MDLELIKLLKDKRVADACQFFDASAYKIYLAKLSYDALNNVISEYQSLETEVVQKVFSDARTTGRGSYKAHDNRINYLGIDVAPTILMDKLTMEIMSLLHNFFDTFAQWINASLYGEACVPMETVSLSKVIRKLPEFSEYTGQFITRLSGLLQSDEYKYISDYNNTLKHRYQIYIENKFDILAIKGSVHVPTFSKDGRPHIKEDALQMLQNKIDFCEALLDESRQYIEQFYSGSDNGHTEHRIYNPQTFLLFRSEEDYAKMRSPKNHYYYIEVDPANIADEYQIMLAYDTMNDGKDKSIELFNSVYQIIMLRERDTQNIVGILKPADTESYMMNDEHELKYRKYLPQLVDYQGEMFKAICGDDTFHYFPMLSNMTGFCETSSKITEESKDVEES